MGYYKDPKRTAQILTKDGWLRTGDIVEVVTKRNSFRIIDRLKSNFKMQTGLYVAPEKIE